ncbi:MAG: hypothetical protein KIS94_10370 [Chitinophagales bacterium]|nr:hypothetical protein [Chitinophagales bacterium]
MKLKDSLRDPSFWTLLAINLALVAYYIYYQTGFRTLVWIYWFQSGIIGFFNFLNLLTIRNIKPGSFTVNDKPVTKDSQARWLALFFAFHYGIFHFVYIIFLYGITDSKEPFDFGLFKISVGAFFLDQLWGFIRAKQWEKTNQTNPGTLFFLPYLRIVPMHLTILLPGFLKAFSHLTVFLVLKTLADTITYLITEWLYGKPDQPDDPNVLRSIRNGQR